MTRRTAMTRREGWTRLSAPGHKLSACWRHDASGWEVRHCGHPTANWPYYAVDPAHQERATVTSSGHGFGSLLIACETVEAILRGELVATNERCGDRTRRVMRPETVPR